MSNSKMLIDAAHPEETRVVVLKGNRVEEFDFESASKKQLRGNIYLAKVTRVEPSLQAAFVEYGGNRHGFLAFSEIHPDYYQIPFADRQALLEEEARANRDEDEEPRESRGGRRGSGGNRGEPRGEKEAAEGGGARADRGNRDGRGEKGAREGRGERGQRRSRRHRRDAVPATALDRRGAGEESISELAFEADEAAEPIAADEGAAAAPPAGGAEGSDVAAEAEAAPEALPGPAAVDEDEQGGAPVAEAVGQAEPVAELIPAVAAEPGFAEPAAEAAAPEAETAGEEPRPVEVLAAEEIAAEVPQIHLAEPVPGSADPLADDAAAEAFAPVDVPGEADVPAEPVEARDARDDEPAAAEHEEEHVEQIGGDALSDVAPRPARLRRHYKIQEVIKRRQILLVQVVKEERGNKGAALTTYLSLAGRYSVLMPNTAKGGGISRKITDGEDRKRLKAIAGELDVPEGMGVILRTAGASRSPVEVRRDFEYLLRMWESVRELTLKSSAPMLVYEEGSLIKRSIRDLYSQDIGEIVVSGEAGFAEARDFMRMLMPGNARSVLAYSDASPIFAKSGVEAQLDAMFSAHVTLKSGGYLVINQTEALVAIDVNSGRSTREHNIEDTALRTNMEAADEVARQLRLRDLAGLIVVDFIDMEEGRNNRAVERRLKDALKNDRARIQIGRISHFGLLEMSRQRMRTGVLEGSTVMCPHCAGAGTVRSTSSIALHVLRLIEDALIRDAAYDLVVRSRAEVALYMLNQKRAKLVELEQRFGVTVTVAADPTLTGTAYHAIERGDLATPAEAPAPRLDRVRVDSVAPIFEAAGEDEEIVESAEEVEVAEDGVDGSPGEGGERRRKRRRRRRGRDRDGASAADATHLPDDGDAAGAERGGEDAAEPIPAIGFSAEPSGADEVGTDAVGIDATGSEETALDPSPAPDAPEPADAAEPVPTEPTVAEEAGAPPEAAADEAPKRRRSRRAAAAAEDAPAPAAGVDAAADEAPKRRRRTSRARAADAGTLDAPEPQAMAAEADAPVGAPPAADRDVGADTVEHHAPETAPSAESAAAAPEAVPAPAEAQPERPKRSGWWQRAKSPFGS